jgi:hypothetical protein
MMLTAISGPGEAGPTFVRLVCDGEIFILMLLAAARCIYSADHFACD